MRVYSIRELTETRLCAAERCEGEAEHNSRLCFRCLRKDDVKLHTPPTVYTGPTLPCCMCKQYKPDEEFPVMRAEKAAARRYRHNECRVCSAKRRRDHRKIWTPEQREAERVRSRATRARKRAEINRIRQAHA